MTDYKLIYDLNGFRRDLFFIIACLDEPSGRQIRDELEPYYDTDIDDGHLYRNLNKLIKTGLVEKGFVDQSGEEARHTTKWYALTRRGEQEFAAHQEWKTQLLE